MAVTERPLTAPVWAETGETFRPTDAEISEGWPLSATPPSRQRFNWILGWLSRAVSYLQQNGIGKWVADVTYAQDGLVVYDGKLWVAKRENTNAQPDTSPDDWQGAGAAIGIGDSDLSAIIAQLAAKDVDLQQQINNILLRLAGLTLNPPGPGGGALDLGPWRIIVGQAETVTGFNDVITLSAPMGGPFAISITESNAVGWGAPGPDGLATGAVTQYGTSPHPDADKFCVSAVTFYQADGTWRYPGLFPGGGTVNFQYIAIGSNPDYVPPAA